MLEATADETVGGRTGRGRSIFGRSDDQPKRWQNFHTSRLSSDNNANMKAMTKLMATAALAAAVACPAAGATPVDPAQTGREIALNTKCYLCHKMDGRGGKIAKPMSAYAHDSAQQLEAGMLDPKKAIGPSTKMPSYKTKLTEAQVQEVIAYIKTLTTP